MIETTVFENALDETQYKNLKEMIFAETFPWFYGNTSYKNQEEENDLCSFEHLVMDNGRKNSDVCNVLDFLLKSKLKQIVDQDFVIFRIRLGMILKEPANVKHKPHVDHAVPHYTGLLYFNNCDADTEIYKETYDIESGSTIKEYLENNLQDKLTLDKTIKSQENKLVLFDGLKYHCSSTPTDTRRRVVLNFNYVYR